MMKTKKYNIASAVAVCMKYAPTAVFGNIILNIASGILSPLMVYAVAVFIDSAVAIASGESRTAELIISVAIMIFGYTYSQLSPVLSRLFIVSTENRLRIKLRPLMIKKHAGLDFELTEMTKRLI